MMVAWQVIVMNVSRLRAAIPGLQKWDRSCWKRNALTVLWIMAFIAAEVPH